MERKKALEIGIAVLVLVLLIVCIVYFLFRQKNDEERISPTALAPVAVQQVSDEDKQNAPPASQVSASVVARTFAERIGSYSSESDYANVDDVADLVTPELAQKLARDARAARDAEGVDGGYYGVSTVFLGATTVSETPTEMNVRVQTQREEAFGTPGNTAIRYQVLTMTLIKTGTSWVV